MAKKDIRICRYHNCKHESKEINITTDDFIMKSNQYFHKDCYQSKLSGAWKTQKQKDDLLLIKTMWFDNISKTVNYSQLYNILNEFISRGIDSEYLVFVIEYCITHKFKLNYPQGIKFYLDNSEIKIAYSKKKVSAMIKKKKEEKSEKEIKPETNVEEPSFTFTQNNKKRGFGNLFE